MDWKYFVRRAADWTIPPAIEGIVLRKRLDVDSYFCDSSLKSLFLRNKKFHNLHKGGRCFILGTGPSINKQDLRPLKNEICIAMSLFCLHKDIKEIDPLYNVDAPNHFPYKFDHIQRGFEVFRESYSSRTSYFFGYTNYGYSVFNFLKQNPQFKNDNIYYLNYSKAIQLNETNFQNSNLWDISKLMFLPRTALYCALQLAAYMGFKYIYLLGCDHDFVAHPGGRSSSYFYKDAGGFDDTLEWSSTEKHLLYLYQIWCQYRLMRSYLESRRCYIYNATEGGMLDVFPRIALSEALTGSFKKDETINDNK
jgi:hypothetical protein